MTTLTTARGVGQSTFARQSLTSALVQTARPKQWSKNVLVFAAPAAAGALLEPATLLAAAAGAVVFSLAAAATYFINDAWDVEVDRGNPRTSSRPVASGRIAPTTAVRIGGGLGVVALTAAIPLGWGFAGVIIAYLALTLAYSSWLKHQPVLDICVVASGFLLRAIAGGAATGIALSQWFLLVAGFGSLFMVAGKRYAEMMLAERTGAKIRKSLESYSSSYLRFVWALSATVLITTYSLWAFEIREEQHNTVWSVISIVPFVIAVLRYSVDVDSGNGGEPEEIALADRVLQVLALLWVGTLVLAVYA